MLLLAVVMLGFAAFLAGEVATTPQRRRHVALRRAATYGAARGPAGQEILRFRERVLVPAVDRLAALALRLNPKASGHLPGGLVGECALTRGEMRIGEARHDALKKLAERVPAPELASFVRSVVQADQLGISLGRILRVQAADSRLRRQAATEEKAMKAPIKMLFPTGLFIFPAMFVAILGPAFLNITTYLSFK